MWMNNIETGVGFEVFYSGGYEEYHFLGYNAV
jgi:hypothetical protein